MPTSVPGRCKPVTCSRGMTLIELLVVIVILGALTAGVGFSFGFARDRGAKEEAERLAMGLESFSLTARTTGKKLAWSYDKGGYRYWQRDGEGTWTVLSAGDFVPRPLPAGVQVAAVLWDGQDLEAEHRAVFGITPPLFRIELLAENHRFRIQGTPTGQVTARRETNGEGVR